MGKITIRRVFGIIAAVLALVFGTIATQNIEVVSKEQGLDRILQNYTPSMINYIGEHWAVLLAVFFAGGAFLIMALEFLPKRHISVSAVNLPGAKLRLLIRPGNGSPERLFHENIWYWYVLHNIIQSTNVVTGETNEHVIVNVFVIFDLPVSGGSIRVNSPDFEIPRYEVKELRERFAIIAFTGALPPGSIEIEVY